MIIIIIVTVTMTAATKITEQSDNIGYRRER
jgi:hypothetical protein